MIEPRPGISFEVPTPTEVIVKGIDKQRSARPPPRSARSARRSRTRARASATRASSSAGRSASAHERIVDDSARRALRRHRRVRGKVARHRRAAAPGRLPLQHGHLRPADRRPRGEDARRGELDRAAEVVQGLEDRAGGRGRQAARRERQEGRCRDASSSTAAATCTTVASRRSPTARAKEDSSFERRLFRARES